MSHGENGNSMEAQEAQDFAIDGQIKWEELQGLIVSLSREDETPEQEFLQEFLVGIQRVHKLSGELRDLILSKIMQDGEQIDDEGELV